MIDQKCEGTKPTGMKNDSSKPMWSRLPFDAVNEIVKVLDHGAQEYSEDNWKYVANFRARYLSATFRHLAKYALGELYDRDSGLHHLAHAGCDIMFLIWKELECSKAQSKKP